MKFIAKLATPATAILCGAAVIAAPTASADVDSSYLGALSGHGITWSSDSTVITVGHAVCTDWAAGNTLQQTLSDVKSGLTNLSDDGAAFMIGAATGAYCPQYESKIH